ncbi:histidine triad nucleotide-binding protein [Calditerricola satsumensis]|uniref:Histidine triad nucleotide-binding protein n=1 Tax=Calditerricola satsumensis TaxID=373054 RepID=A0A8J3BCW1_9BACI|nr:histidine triad nucleotide-binding protein [Calditerricola satsumensis]GGJ95288.1 histidine triad nucleotide-binding protein [Calditerricola satsumensis]
MPQDCVFCKIIEKQLPARFEHEDEQVVVFHDINPKAPTHLLIVPRKHIPTMMDVAKEDLPLIAHIHAVAQELYRKLGLTGMRLVNNCNKDGGQEVFHLHYHLMGWKGANG